MSSEVYILGAGFSKAIYDYMPLLKDLSLSATRQLRQDYNIRHSKEDIDIKLIEHFNSLPKQISYNLESLLCYLIQDYPWKTDITKYFDKALYEYLVSEIAKEFKTKWAALGQEKFGIDKFFKYIHSRSVPVITFNYDTIFEQLYINHCTSNKHIKYTKNADNYDIEYFIRLYDEYSLIPDEEKLQKDGYIIGNDSFSTNTRKVWKLQTINLRKLQDCGQLELDSKDIMKIEALTYKPLKLNHLYKMPMTYINNRLSKNGNDSKWEYEIAHLLKLHGSANWYYNDKDIFYEDFNIRWDYELNPKEFHNNPGGDVRIDYLNYYNSARFGLKPLIIPPVLDKTSFYSNNILRDIWGQAAEYLQKADEINIIGYSIPETDIAINYFLLSNIKQDVQINIINFLKTDNREELDKYKTSLKNKLSEFPNVNTDYTSNDENEVFKRFVNDRMIAKSNINHV